MESHLANGSEDGDNAVALGVPHGLDRLADVRVWQGDVLTRGSSVHVHQGEVAVVNVDELVLLARHVRHLKDSDGSQM